jgi:hypothetical protein
LGWLLEDVSNDVDLFVIDYNGLGRQELQPKCNIFLGFLFISYFSFLTFHFLLFISYFSFLTFHFLLFISYFSFLTFHFSLFIFHFILSKIFLGGECWDNIEKVVRSRGIVLTSTGGGGRNDNCNYDMYTNSPYALSISSHSIGGQPSSFAGTCANAVSSFNLLKIKIFLQIPFFSKFKKLII